MAEEMIIVDTSVVIKWFIKEDHSERAGKILLDMEKKKIKVILPNIVLLELINALSLGIQKLPEIEIQEAINYLFNLQELQQIEFTSSTKENLLNVINIVNSFKIASYDALFIAIAKEKNCVLLTADRKHHKKEIYSKIKYL